jgi:TPR repeat protein
VARNEAQAVAWFRQAAMQDLPAAQRLIGVAYAEGLGVPGDACRAVADAARRRTGRCRRPVQSGRDAGQRQGTERDEELALVWYQRAAEAGHVLAQYNLGAMYARGRGSTGRAPRAGWYRRAAEQGAASAQFNLA